MSYVLISMGALQLPLGDPILPAPSNVSAVYNVLKGWVEITWTDNSSDEDNFRIEVDVDGGGYNFLVDPAVNDVSYNHSPVTAGSTYTYRIRAERTADNSAWATSNDETIPI